MGPHRGDCRGARPLVSGVVHQHGVSESDGPFVGAMEGAKG